MYLICIPLFTGLYDDPPHKMTLLHSLQFPGKCLYSV